MLELLLLIIVANSAPVLARNLLRDRWAWPIDGGYELADGQPLLGSSKTWRGVVAATLACVACASVLGLGWAPGLLAAAAAMAGDLFASFCKRRLRIAASGHAPLLDSIPEALAPALVLRADLALGWYEVALVVVAFAALVALSSPWLYRLHIRRRPW